MGRPRQRWKVHLTGLQGIMFVKKEEERLRQNTTQTIDTNSM